MGLIVDSSVLIAAERGKFDLAEFFAAHAGLSISIAAVTYSELWHGIHRDPFPPRKLKRQQSIGDILAHLPIICFCEAEATVHSKIWADLESRGERIGPHDMQIAATALAHDHELATLNKGEFQRVPNLRLIDTDPYFLPPTAR